MIWHQFVYNLKTISDSSKTRVRSVVLLIGNVIYIIVCAFSISIIENYYTKGLVLKRYFIMKELKEVMVAWESDPPARYNGSYDYTALTSKQWDELKELSKKRCFKVDNMHTQNHLWNFWSSLDFCATVLTTIGYGNIYPRTTAGKMFTLLYSLLGIPLMAMYLSIFSRIVYRFTSKIIICFTKNFKSYLNRKCTNVQVKAISVGMVSVLLFMYVGGLSALMSHTNKQDSFIVCMYFYIITLTTVGIGDIAMTEAKPFVLIRIFLVFCVGLTLVTTVFNAIRHLIAANKLALRRARLKMGAAAVFIATYKRVRRVSRMWKPKSRGSRSSIRKDSNIGVDNDAIKLNGSVDDSSANRVEVTFISECGECGMEKSSLEDNTKTENCDQFQEDRLSFNNCNGRHKR